MNNNVACLHLKHILYLSIRFWGSFKDTDVLVGYFKCNARFSAVF